MVDKDLKRLIFENKLPPVTEIKSLPTRTSSSSSALPTLLPQQVEVEVNQQLMIQLLQLLGSSIITEVTSIQN
jgi:hypothetical protein